MQKSHINTNTVPNATTVLNTSTDKYYLKFLKYKYKYENLLANTNSVNQLGGNLYNVHHTGGQLGEAETAAKIVDITNYRQWFALMSEWSKYHDDVRLNDTERTEAREQIQIMLNEINQLFIKAKSEIRFRWTSVNWNSGVQWLN